MNKYKSKLNEWKLFQNSIVDQVSYLKHRIEIEVLWGCKEEVSRLEAVLEEINPNTLTQKV